MEGRRRCDVDEQVQERMEVIARIVQATGRRPELRVRVDDREIDLVLVGAEIHEQLVDVVEHLCRTGVRAIDLVEGDHDREAPGHRLLQHVARLRQRPLRRIDEEQHAVHHQQRSLDLPAEVGMAGRIDDVEADVAVVDGRLLGEDRDPLLALEIARIHDAVHHRLIGPERSRLAKHRVDQRGLAVVHMGDDRDVSDVVACPDQDGIVGGRRTHVGAGHGGAGSGGIGHGARAVSHIVPFRAVMREDARGGRRRPALLASGTR